MRLCFKHALKALCGAAALGLSGILSSALAAEFPINDPESAPFNYAVCYAVADTMNPGPAAHYGEDVCVDYVAANGGIVQIVDNADGTTDLNWALFQHGTATITAQIDNAILYEGSFQAEEIAQDLGDDAGCLWQSIDGGDDQHAWLGNCEAPYGSLDQLTWKLEFHGETPFLYEAFVSGPGNWCAYDSNGQSHGPGCS